ncbi:MAG: sodium:proton antiporter [Treponema sp.]|jgi:predicted histidine transporter YuiF (NhaC family)|nr:sodium:proton antiporter [Treponema sp.]
MLTNPVLISVLLMSVLCLVKVNILLAILISAVTAGLLAGFGFGETMGLVISGMGGQAETSLSYVLLGALAVGIAETGLAAMLAKGIQKLVGKKGMVFLIVLALVSSCSQNIIPVHIAFIPILIPPLLSMMNAMRLDRRGAACALTFGLKAPYIMLPAGFGLIFHGIIADSLAANGMTGADKSKIWSYMLIPGAGMALGFLIAVFFSYRRPRNYENKSLLAGDTDSSAYVSGAFTRKHLGAAAGAVSAFVIQLLTGSLPLGALVGIGIMTAFGAIPFKAIDSTISGGIQLMGFIAFVMLVASGYANVIRESGGVDAIVQASAAMVGGNKIIAAVMMLLIGLIITMGIGSSFGTIPIVAAIYVPLCIQLGFSVPATAILVGVAGALGDAGSPASDSTLGPTSGLNADGQHNHIWDTCVPTFIHYNIPLLIFGTIGAVVF